MKSRGEALEIWKKMTPSDRSILHRNSHWAHMPFELFAASSSAIQRAINEKKGTQ